MYGWQSRSLSSSVLVPGQEGDKLASFPEPLCACVLIVRKATAPGVEEDLCVPSLCPHLTGLRPCASRFFFLFLRLLPSHAFNRSGNQRLKKL